MANTGKQEILFVGNYNRSDYLSLLNKCLPCISFSFLYFSSSKEETNQGYRHYGKAFYWKDFNDAFELLETLKPAKVIFFYIATYNHVVLNLACRYKGIPTYQLEHGLRADYVAGFAPATSPKAPATLLQRLKKTKALFLDAPARVKNRLFLLNSIKLLPPKAAAFAEAYIRVRKKHNFLETNRIIPSPERTADFYISFSKYIYKIHEREDALPPDKKVYYIGIPYFDHLANTIPTAPAKAILLIDQPLAEQNLLGWNATYKHDFAKQLSRICQQLDYQLLVKPHPVQDLSVWQMLAKEYNVTLITDAAIAALAPQMRIVLGFYSTYLLPFAALNHITLVTYENHPAGKLMLSNIFTEAGVGHAIADLQELRTLLPALGELHRQQLPNKAEFIKNWLYKFDGKSGERLRDVLSSSPPILHYN